MLIEIEGMNHTGKTTLVAALAAKGYNTHKFERTEENPIVQMYTHHLSLAADPKLWVIDRGHGTEWVMSNILSRQVPYTQLAFWTLDENLSQLDTVIVFLWAPNSVIQKRITNTGRMWEAPYPFLVSTWEMFLMGTQCHVVTLDGSQPIDDLVDQFEQQVMFLFFTQKGRRDEQAGS
jgi:hypothetical protein